MIDAVSTGFPYWRDRQGFYAGISVRHNIFYQSDPADFLYSLHKGWTDQTLA